MITQNNIKSGLLQSCEERNSPHNMQCGSAAVALITQPIQPEPQVLAALIRHMASRTCAGGEMDAPVSATKYPPVHPPPSSTWCPPKDHHGLGCPARDTFCPQRAGSRGVGGGGSDKRCIYSSWFRMPAGRQWTHSSVPKTNSCVQPSLPGRWERGSEASAVGMKGKFPEVDMSVLQKLEGQMRSSGYPLTATFSPSCC